MPLVDLHTHSCKSDGMNTPAEVVQLAHKKKVQLLALADHDTVDGYQEASAEAEKLGVPFISGVEITTNIHDRMHILGFRVDTANRHLNQYLDHCRNKRFTRIRNIVNQLNETGVAITYEEVIAQAAATPGRAHVADAMKKKGLVANRKEAFRRYLLPGRPGYAPPAGESVEEAIYAITQAGGFPVIAHPGAVQEHWNFPAWKTSGLMGAETFYPSHTEPVTRALLELTRKYGLLATAGSDYHGLAGEPNKPLGMEIPEDNFKAIKKALL